MAGGPYCGPNISSTNAMEDKGTPTTATSDEAIPATTK